MTESYPDILNRIPKISRWVAIPVIPILASVAGILWVFEKLGITQRPENHSWEPGIKDFEG